MLDGDSFVWTLFCLTGKIIKYANSNPVILKCNNVIIWIELYKRAGEHIFYTRVTFVWKSRCHSHTHQNDLFILKAYLSLELNWNYLCFDFGVRNKKPLMRTGTLRLLSAHISLTLFRSNSSGSDCYQKSRSLSSTNCFWVRISFWIFETWEALLSRNREQDDTLYTAWKQSLHL